MTTPNKIYQPHFPRSQGSAFPWGEAPWRADPLLKNGICINLETEQPFSSIFFFRLCKSCAPWGEWEGGSFVVPEKKDSEGWCDRALYPTGACLFHLLPGSLVEEVSPTLLAASVSVWLSLDEMLQLV